MAVTEGQWLWSPRPDYAARSQLAQFMDWLRRTRDLDIADYETLRQWSVAEPEGFWSALWDYFDIQADGSSTPVREGEGMMETRWFTGARVNYAEHLLRYEAKAAEGETAIFHQTENRPLDRMSWQQLGHQVRVLATRLRAMGIRPGDRVVSYMPNVPETTVAMIATIAVGAVWSSTAPEFGIRTVIDRLSQIEPKLIFVSDGYRFGGKDFDRTEEVRQIVAGLPTLEQVIWLPYLRPERTTPPVPDALSWAEALSGPAVPPHAFHYERVDNQHPLWVMFSSGTTGLPKAITHNHVGQLVEHLKLSAFHFNLAPGQVMFFHSTTGWAMYQLLEIGRAHV